MSNDTANGRVWGKRVKPVLTVFMLLAIVSVLMPATSLAQVDTFEFETPEQQQRFRALSDELRCPMCQNTSLSGSTGGVAEDLRREVHRMIMEGDERRADRAVYVRALR